MDFTQRSDNSNRPAATTSAAPAPQKPVRKSARAWRWVRYTSALLLVSVGVLLIALTASIALTQSGASESKYVNSKNLQAVFLNGGQVYFGHITNLNSKFVAMSGIYYLRVNQSVQPTATTSTSSNDVSLVKLGCELHGPEDQMVISQDQVIFWENLKTDGQVAKAVAQFQKNNPNGQTCNTAATSTTSTTTKQ